MESWRRAWRNGFVPQLSIPALQALRKALITNDKRLIQGSTTSPPPLQSVRDWLVEGACAIGFCGWIGEEKESVGEVEKFFAQRCFECDNNLGEPAGCRWFLNWFDETPRSEVRNELLPEVKLAIETKQPKTNLPRGGYF
jgi:hypothetical protein